MIAETKLIVKNQPQVPSTTGRDQIFTKQVQVEIWDFGDHFTTTEQH